MALILDVTNEVCLQVADYDFKNVMRLYLDYQRGRFDYAFPDRQEQWALVRFILQSQQIIRRNPQCPRQRRQCPRRNLRILAEFNSRNRILRDTADFL